MKTLEMQPTEEVIRKTYIDDTIKRTESVNSFINFLNTREGHSAIAITSNWGSGKTFFVKQVKLVLDALNNYSTLQNKEEIKIKFEEASNSEALILHKSFYYDAWENDNDEDPILSLVYSIMKDSNIKMESQNKLWIVLCSIADMVTGRNISQIVKSFNAESSSDEILAKIKNEKKLQEQVYNFFDLLLIEQGDRLAIFIDELDRCKPTYAVKLLERIKHYCMHDRVSFVFSVNISELANTIKQCYGADFNAMRYLDRFFNSKRPLPKADMNKFLELVDLKNSPATRGYYVDISQSFIEFYNLELREITKYAQAIKYIDQCYLNKLSKNSWMPPEYDLLLLYCFTPIIIGLHFIDDELYKQFLQGTNSEPFIKVMKDLWLAADLCSNMLKENEELSTKDTKGNITIEDKLQQIYHDFFIYPRPTTYAKYTVKDKYKSTREYLLKITSSFY